MGSIHTNNNPIQLDMSYLSSLLLSSLVVVSTAAPSSPEKVESRHFTNPAYSVYNQGYNTVGFGNPGHVFTGYNNQFNGYNNPYNGYNNPFNGYNNHHGNGY